MTHAEAVYSLARQFDSREWLVFTECGVGPDHDGFPDILLIRKSYSRPETRVYEVKVTDSDFTQDVRAGKFQKYMDYADRLYFALGPGIKADWKDKLAGQQVGVMSFRGDQWVNNRPAPRLQHEKRIDWKFFLALLMGGKEIGRGGRLSRLEAHRANLLKIENLEATYSVNKVLDRKLDEFKSKRTEFENLVKSAEKEARKRLRARLGLTEGWYGSDIIDDLYDATIQSALYAANRTFKERLTAMFPPGEESDG